MGKICFSCKKELGIMTGKIYLADGAICTRCYEQFGYSSWRGLEMAENSKLTIKQFIEKSALDYDHIDEISSFKPTASPAPFAKFDDINKKMIISPKMHSIYNPIHFKLFEYQQLLNFELLENGMEIASGGIGRSIVGGLLFGEVGAIVGGITSKRTQTCSQLQMKLTVKNDNKPAFYIDLIETECSKTGMIYKQSIRYAQDVLSQLQLVANMIKEEVDSKDNDHSIISVADEIRKFKDLMDEGIITQEEYEKKKNQLLDM